MKHGLDLATPGPRPGLRRNWRNNDAFQILTRLGLASGLQLCLDAGDAASYTSGQSWLDLSGNGYDFFLGADGSAAADDPTFNGTAGGLSSGEYWGFDGGDFFRLGQSNPTWVNNLHKDNAAFTFIWWAYLASTSVVGQRLMSTANNAATDTGIKIYFGSSAVNGRVNVDVNAADGTDITDPNFASATNPTVGGWNYVAMSADEASGTWLSQVNGTADADSSTYISASSAAATDILQIGADSDGTEPLQSGGRIAAVCAWSRALSAAELMAIYDMTRGRFGV